jgi:hypothetical protein
MLKVTDEAVQKLREAISTLDINGKSIRVFLNGFG